jgi:glycerol uptake facilitator-like aquaporin
MRTRAVVLRETGTVAAEPAPGLGRRLAAETVGSALLLATVVGSGIMGERLAEGNAGIALLANSLATGAGLLALIAALGPVSGAHFNPIVTAVQTIRGVLPLKHAGGYVAMQVFGAIAGVALAHAMFGQPIFSASARDRSGASQALSEVVASFGLVTIAWGSSRMGFLVAGLAIAGYVTAAYWFTASTCFANPSVTLARSMTDTFTGIRPGDVPVFIGAQILGGAAAVAFGRWIFGPSDVVLPGAGRSPSTELE